MSEDLVRMPLAFRAVVDDAKIRRYLLSDLHPVGRAKALVFRSLGYSLADWTRLARDLRLHAVHNDVAARTRTPYGVKFEIRGTLLGPSGKTLDLVSVWIVLIGENVPRFVTAYPGARE